MKTREPPELGSAGELLPFGRGVASVFSVNENDDKTITKLKR